MLDVTGKRNAGTVLFLALFSFFVAFPVCGQEKSPVNAEPVPPGMEVVQFSEGYRLLVPAGTKVKKVGGQIILEDTVEHTAKQLYGMEERLVKILQRQEYFEKRLKNLSEEIALKLERLQETLNELKQNDAARELKFEELKENLQSSVKQ